MHRYHFMTLAACLSIAAAAPAVALAEDAVYSCIAADGTAELVSAPTGGQCEKLVSSPDPVAPAAAPAVAADTAASGAAEQKPAVTAPTQAPATMKSATLIPPPDVAQSPRNAVETRLSQYRSTMIDQASQVSVDTQQANSPTTASSRRYLMMNRTTYQQTLGISPR